MSETRRVREPAVAGHFYPAEPSGLATQVRAVLDGQEAFPSKPLAVISPHAGYRFSGALTARALATSGGMTPSCIVILSPSHRHAFNGIAAPSEDGFRIPTGVLPMDTTARAALIAANLVHIEDAAHDREHGIEVQLPFLHKLHPGVPILPLVLGRVDTDTVARVVDTQISRAPDTFFVLSSDLSHFLTRDQAVARDAATARRIETGEATLLRPEDACGARAIAGFFASQLAGGARLTRLGLMNSASATQDEARTVGYGAWAITNGRDEALSDRFRSQLLRTARQVLQSRFAKGKPPHIDTSSFPAPLQTHAACFVTLEQNGRLRGCIGSLQAHRPLIEDVAANVQKAAFEDPRFKPLPQADLDRTSLKLAILSPARRMAFNGQYDLETQLTPHRDGLILREQGRAGTFLPMVWEKLEDPHAFVQALKVKAGLPPDHWSDTLTIDRFHAETFSES